MNVPLCATDFHFTKQHNDLIKFLECCEITLKLAEVNKLDPVWEGFINPGMWSQGSIVRGCIALLSRKTAVHLAYYAMNMELICCLNFITQVPDTLYLP